MLLENFQKLLSRCDGSNRHVASRGAITLRHSSAVSSIGFARTNSTSRSIIRFRHADASATGAPSRCAALLRAQSPKAGAGMRWRALRALQTKEGETPISAAISRMVSPLSSSSASRS